MITATQVAAVLEKTKLTNLSENNKNRYGYLLLKIETEFHRVLLYQKDLLLCSGRGRELWTSFQAFKKQASIVWKLLTSAGLPKAFLDNFKSNNSKLKDEHDNNNNNNSDIAIDPFFQENNDPFIPAIPALQEIPNTADKSLVNLLEQARPTIYQRQARHPALLGLGLGLISSLFLTQFFGSSNTQDIQKLNNDMIKQNKLLKLTNQRIDIFANNVTRQVNTIKTVLDKIVESQEMQDIHYAILWNFEQIVQSSNIVKNEFRSGEVTVTLLEENILNPELINLHSLNKTVTEGLQSFPDLEFPVEINRYNMPQIIKLLKIQRVSHLKFLIIIPLTHKMPYTAYSLVPHPVKIDQNSLAIPEMKEILLKGHGNYILAEKRDIYSLTKNLHILLTVEPIYNDKKITCEYAGFLKMSQDMLSICNYRKAGQVADTLVIETNTKRLVYFSKLTRVTFDCPDKIVKDSFLGLHKLPLACDIITDDVRWPAKQSVEVESLSNNEILSLDTTELPIACVNKSSKVHKSLRELIDKLNVNESYTIDFSAYGLTLDQVATYSAIAQSIITPIVIINSIILAFLVAKWILHRRHEILSRASSMHNKFGKVRDSIRSRKGSIRRSIHNKGHSLRRSIKEHRNSIRNKLQQSPYVMRYTPNSLGEQSHANVGTNTDLDLTVSENIHAKALNPKIINATELYPALPRYN